MRARIVAAGALYVVGWFWNRFLFPLGGVCGDVIAIGRWLFCVGDVAYLLAFAVLLSIPMRRVE